jgi:Concanavalin A-like lectin/glucanases superfamily/Secretion system C-terminal sorting domain
MNSKFNFVYTLFVGLLFIALFSGYSDGYDDDRTGSPNAGGTCANCHSGGTGGGSITLMGAPTSYVRNTTYTMTLKVTDADMERAGFQITAVDASNNYVGTFIENPSAVREASAFPGLTHGTPRTPISGVVSWTIQWTAPSTGNAPVKFYYAGNAATGGGTGGDFIYIGSSSAFIPLSGGCTVATTPTTTNNALSFDGTNDAVSVTSCSNADPIVSKSALTIEYWFKGSSPQSAVRMQSGSDFIVAGWNSSGVFKHIISTDGGTAGLAVGATATNGSWHHVAMTWQQNTTNGFKSYLDGVLVAQRNSSNTPLPTISANMFIGSFNGGSEYMNGTIDEVRVWSVARTQAQLIASANACSFTTPQTGLQLYFKFNHGAVSGSNAGITGLVNSATTDFSGTAQDFALTGSSSNWVAGTCITLPVELLSFKGKNIANPDKLGTEGGNVLTWTTATELNFSHFDIERSNDGKTFEKIGETKAKGSNSTYTFTDNFNDTKTSGRFETSPTLTHYYRLKINDLDGKSDYSKIINLESPKILRGVKIYPNPVSTTLNIQTENNSDFLILNLLGQQVLRGQTAQNVDVSALPQGNYVLKVGTEQVKFVKQ